MEQKVIEERITCIVFIASSQYACSPTAHSDDGISPQHIRVPGDPSSISPEIYKNIESHIANKYVFSRKISLLDIVKISSVEVFSFRSCPHPTHPTGTREIYCRPADAEVAHLPKMT